MYLSRDSKACAPGPRRPLHAKVLRWIGGDLLLSMRWLICWVSPMSLRRLAYSLLWLLGPLARRQNAKIRENLRRCLGDVLPEAEQHAIARRVLPEALWGIFLTVAAADRRMRQAILDMAEIRGLEHLKTALARGRGVIALSCHLGPLPVLCAKLGAQDFRYSVMVRRLSDYRLDSKLAGLCERAGVNILYRGRDGRELFYALRRGEVVHLLMDQHASEGGAVVEFFDQPMPVFTGPAVLARLLDCPVLPIFLVPVGGDHWAVEIGLPLELAWSDDKEADILRVTQAFMATIENVVRQHPEHFHWTNSCWLRPDDTPRQIMAHLLDKVPSEVRERLLEACATPTNVAASLGASTRRCRSTWSTWGPCLSPRPGSEPSCSTCVCGRDTAISEATRSSRCGRRIFIVPFSESTCLRSGGRGID